MKTSITLTVLLATASIFAAEPKDEVKAAAKKLGQSANYSWVTTPKSDGNNARQGAIEGKTEKDGYTYATLNVGIIDVELAFKGDKAAIMRETGWQSADELEGADAWIARRLKSVKPPAVEAEELAGKVSELKKGNDGEYSGDLTEAGVKEIYALARRRATGPSPENAKGSAKFWVKEGLLTKYEFSIQGKVSGGEGKPAAEFNRGMTVEIKDVGKTEVKVPDAAKKKLS